MLELEIMSDTPLHSIEWHDLPVSALSITEHGISLVVTPWVEATGSYVSCTLSISGGDAFELDMAGPLSPKDLTSLEVSSFDYSIDPNGRLNGVIGILPGAAGYWTISFANAAWTLDGA